MALTMQHSPSPDLNESTEEFVMIPTKAIYLQCKLCLLLNLPGNDGVGV